MSTGSLSDVEDLQEVEMLECDGLKMDTNKEFGASTESNEEGSNGENGSPQKGRGASGKRKKAPPKKSPLNGVSQEGKQVQRNAANARERARMRVLSKAFSRLKTTLPWVPPDTKLSKLDTLRLASSYIAHLRQILANDKYENGYIHPVNLKVLMKLRKPRITATIWSSGKVICTGATSEEEAKFGARRLARSLQKLGFQVIFTDFKVVNVLAVCNMPFEIRLPEFTKNNRPHARDDLVFTSLQPYIE
ncbi:Transcription factor 21 [Pitangus sulphuratus]|nr:Transcription factor 21 [Pitangus sulphuratus]